MLERCCDARAAAETLGHQRQSPHRAARVALAQHVGDANEPGMEQEGVSLNPLPDQSAHEAEQITIIDLHRAGYIEQNHESDRPLRPVLAPQFDRLAAARQVAPDRPAQIDRVAATRRHAPAAQAIAHRARQPLGDALRLGDVHAWTLSLFKYDDVPALLREQRGDVDPTGPPPMTRASHSRRSCTPLIQYRLDLSSPIAAALARAGPAAKGPPSRRSAAKHH